LTTTTIVLRSALAGEVSTRQRRAASLAGADVAGLTALLAVAAEVANVGAERTLLAILDRGVFAFTLVALDLAAHQRVAVAGFAALQTIDACAFAAALAFSTGTVQDSAAAVVSLPALSRVIGRAGLR
jgi:hypothetical protein